MHVQFVKVLFVFTLSFVMVEQMVNVPTTINDFHLPGSQPGDSGNLENPTKCDNCHGGYNQAVEPAYNWRGSMMAQAARDPLFYAALAIANQDAPESGDFCLRCHSPKGWLEGRSVPTDGTALTAADREGVQCDFCHKLVKPTLLDVNPYPDDPDYTSGTYPADQAYLATLDEIPAFAANGMYIADSDNGKRGPFTDAEATHQFYYSPFHRESAICGTCHDVSNPAFSAVTDSTGNILYYEPNAFNTPPPSSDPHLMFPVERTYSEWLVSAYNSPDGIPSPHFGGNKANVASCQDCHMQDVTGPGCNKNNVPIRDDLPLHDMTGGNTFIPLMIDDAFPGETDTAALADGILRARYMLEHAATMDLSYDTTGQTAVVTITNETGHKLPTGYPEGRRMWIHLRAFGPNGEVFESGYYDPDSADLVNDPDLKVYEIKPGISQTLSPIVGIPAGPSFHFVLNDTIYKDNRIPPRGFTNAAFDSIQSPVVDYSYPDSQYWDVTTYPIPFPPVAMEASLYYQTAAREYIVFLKEENNTNDWGDILYNLWEQHGKSTPEQMQYKTWGEAIVDADEDGWPSIVDCNDANPDIHPGAEELLDCLDNNCDGVVDEIFNSDSLHAWTGCGGTADWHDPDNWNMHAVPTPESAVLIPGLIAGDSFPSIRTPITIRALHVEPLASCDIASGGDLVLDGPSIWAGVLSVHGEMYIMGTASIGPLAETGVQLGINGHLEISGSMTLTAIGATGILNGGQLEIGPGATLTIQVLPGFHAIHHLPGSAMETSGNINLSAQE